MLTTTELNRGSTMANVDYTVILGKRVKLTLKPTFDFPNFGDLVVTGVCVGFVVTAPNYPQFKTDEILFLEDGFNEPDFFNFNHLELIG